MFCLVAGNRMGRVMRWHVTKEGFQESGIETHKLRLAAYPGRFLGKIGGHAVAS